MAQERRGRWLQLIVQFFAIGIGAGLDDSLADLIASLKVDSSWRWPLVVLLMPHSWRSCCHLLIIYGGKIDVADVVGQHVADVAYVINVINIIHSR